MRLTRRFWYGLLAAAVAIPLGAATVATAVPTAGAAHRHSPRNTGLHAPPANVTPPSMAHRQVATPAATATPAH